MKDCNRAISKLTKQNQHLESTRRTRSRYDHFKVIRDCAREVYNALCTSFSCSCVSQHSISWQLDVPFQQSGIQFRVVATNNLVDDSDDNLKIYHEIELRPANIAAETVEQEQAQAIQNYPSKKKARFLEDPTNSNVSMVRYNIANSSGSTTMTFSRTFSSLGINDQDSVYRVNSPRVDLAITDFCRRLCASNFDCRERCLGYIRAATEDYFEIFPLDKWRIGDSRPTSLSLASLFSQARAPSLASPLTLVDRLHLAKSVATGVLQLYNSPLLERRWTKEDITFLPRASLSTERPFRKAYITKNVQTPNSTASNPCQPKPTPFIHNSTIFALGILLVEICLGRSIDDLRVPEDFPTEDHLQKPDVFTDYSTAMRLLDNGSIFEESGSELYESAVRHCVRCNFKPNSTDLENAAFRQAVYSGVVALLEDQVSVVMGTKSL